MPPQGGTWRLPRPAACKPGNGGAAKQPRPQPSQDAPASGVLWGRSPAPAGPAVGHPGGEVCRSEAEDRSCDLRSRSRRTASPAGWPSAATAGAPSFPSATRVQRGEPALRPSGIRAGVESGDTVLVALLQIGLVQATSNFFGIQLIYGSFTGGCTCMSTVKVQ